MPKNPDLSRTPDYFSARAVEERRLAMSAKDPKVRAIHLELAEKYEAVAQATGGGVSPQQDVDGEQERDRA